MSSTVRFADKHEVIEILSHETESSNTEEMAERKSSLQTPNEEPEKGNLPHDNLIVPEKHVDGRFTVKRMDTVDQIALVDADKKKEDSVSDTHTFNDYDDDMTDTYISEFSHQRPSMFEAVTAYKGGLVPAPDSPEKSRRLGTILGVYFPCFQNILGVIVFIRYPWIIGIAGISGALGISCLCCLCTLLTAVSMSAIATNGRVPAGGAYFMISRSLGPAVGGAVGILFYIANSLSCAMYTVGAVEILIKYICPKQCLLFGKDVEDAATAFNHFRIYGVILLIIICLIVLIGIRFVSIFAPISLVCVIFSVLCIYIGLIKASFIKPVVPMCMLQGLHLIKSNVLRNNITGYCYPNSSYLLNVTEFTHSALAPLVSSAIVDQGVPGLGHSQFPRNWPSSFLGFGEVAPGVAALDPNLEVYSQQITNFFVLIGIYFPSVTGIMAGSNRSGDLKDPSVSIPRGTIAAIITTSFIYITYAFMVGSSIDGRLLRDKYGDSIDKALVISMIAWPSKWVILIGALLSTLGAGLQSLTGAPRILQALANDDVIPFLKVFGRTSKSGEPRRAILLTTGIALVGVLIADLDKLTPLLSMFFLLCYGFVNLACALQSLLGTPNWRPTFKYYHWTLSILGVCLCLAIMFMASWYFALVAVAVAAIVYKYIEYKGAEKEWGDGLTGLQLSAALYALSHLEEDKERHFRNWRPELLVLVQTTDDGSSLIDDRVLSFTRQLKAGGGLVITGTTLVINDYLDIEVLHMAAKVRTTISQQNKKNHLRAFRSVVTAKTLLDGLVQLIQNSGLGGMRPNTLVIAWPSHWRDVETDVNIDNITSSTFLHTLRIAERSSLATMVPKNIQTFPKKGDTLSKSATIDVWWILHDAGLMLLIAYLLRKHRLWKQHALRIFTVAESANDSMLARTYIQNVMRLIRIPFQNITVIVLDSSDISAYAYERTVEVEHGSKILKEIDKQRRALSQQRDCQFTFTPVAGGIMNLKKRGGLDNYTHDRKKVHSALKINQALRENSKDAGLIIVNLPPAPPMTKEAERTYMNFIEVLTDQLNNPILMIRGTGRELITSVD